MLIQRREEFFFPKALLVGIGKCLSQRRCKQNSPVRHRLNAGDSASIVPVQDAAKAGEQPDHDGRPRCSGLICRLAEITHRGAGVWPGIEFID